MKLLDLEFKVIDTNDERTIPRKPIGTEGPIAPWVLTPCVNVYCDGEKSPVYLWLQLAPDLSIEECDHDSIGSEPEWLTAVKEGESISDIIESDMPYEPDLPRVNWALQEGIGLGQPFCVELYPPKWSSDYYGECDCEHNWSIVRVTDRANPRKVAASWGRFLESSTMWRTRQERQKQHVQKRRLRDREALYLQSQNYFAHGTGHDDMDMPGGYRVHLCSKIQKAGRWPCLGPILCSAEDDSGDRSAVMEKLNEKAQELFPGLDLSQLTDRQWHPAGI